MTGGGGGRRERILGLLVRGGEGGFGTKRLCQVCAEATATSGAGIMLMSGDTPHGSLCTTNEMSDLIRAVAVLPRGGALRGCLPPGLSRART